MYRFILVLFITFLSGASTRSILGENLLKMINWKHKQNKDNVPQPVVPDSASKSSQVIVLQMHYDCQGKLVRQEASRVNFVTGLVQIPGEEDIFRNVFSTDEPLPMASKVENNDINQIYNRVKESVTQTPGPAMYRSQEGRLRKGPITPRRSPLDPTTTRPSFKGNTIVLSPMNGNMTNKPKLIVGPDTLIGTPIKSCPLGENEDRFGECRPEFPKF